MLATLSKAAKSTANITYVGGYTEAFVGQTSDYTVTFGGNLTGGVASSASAGDLVIVYFGTGSIVNNDLVVNEYKEIAELYADDTNDTSLVVAYKFMGSTPDTTFTLTGGTQGGTDAGAVAVQVWRNVDVLPFDVVATTATGTNSVLCNPPAITPLTAGSYIVSGGAGGHLRGAQTYSSSDLTNFISSGENDTYDVTIGLGYKEWTSGEFNPAEFSFSGVNSSNYSWAAVTLALRPAGSYTGTKPKFVASASTQNTSTGTSLVIDKPTGTVEGDLMVGIMFCNNARHWTGDTGWTEVADQGSNPSLRVVYRVAGANEGSSYTFTASSSSSLSGSILTYKNAAYDTIGSIATGANPLVVTGPTAAADYCLLIGAVGRSSTSLTIAAPSLMTTRVTDNDATYEPSYVVADEYVASGATGTRSFSNLGGTTNSAGVLLTIKPS